VVEVGAEALLPSLRLMRCWVPMFALFTLPVESTILIILFGDFTLKFDD
jgi:hypothetical protein